MLAALIKEIKLRANEIEGKQLETIYFGGGSPSIWAAKDIKSIITSIANIVSIDGVKEITLEANPDDLTKEYAEELAAIGINRFSMGIQSFNAAELKWMNRVHTAKQAHECIQNAKAAGINNLNIDLIYGSPASSMEIWEENLNYFKQYQVDHLSAYMLTVEPKTALGIAVKNNNVLVDDALAIQQFKRLKQWARQKGLEHYEISNFCLNKKRAFHNANYWNGKAYVGIGPGSHSFNGQRQRSWNVSNNSIYLKSLTENKLPSTAETLTAIDQLNEAIMLGLRQIEGLSLDTLSHKFLPEYLEQVQENAKEIAPKLLIKDHKNLRLTEDGLLHADGVISALMLTN